jgi:hypothetical protein
VSKSYLSGDEFVSFSFLRECRLARIDPIAAERDHMPIFGLADLGTIASEFAGIAPGLGIFGLSKYLTVVYQAEIKGDSRYWRISDIQRFSQPDRFRFEIVSYLPKAGGPTEDYDFQLFDDLPSGVYDYLWVRLHPSSYYPDIRP